MKENSTAHDTSDKDVSRVFCRARMQLLLLVHRGINE